MAIPGGQLPEPPEGSRDAQDFILEVVKRPIQYASLFYALLYLVQIEDRGDAEFDFRQVMRTCERGLFWYGVYAVIRELGSAETIYLIQPDQAVEEQTMLRDASEAQIREHLERYELPDMADKLDSIRLVGSQSGREDWRVSRVLNAAGTIGFRWWTQPYGTVEEIREFFEFSPKTYQRPRRNPLFSEGWTNPEFNGPAWVGIADHVLRHADLPPVAWVDQSWAIEHNNRGWLDKHDPVDKDSFVAEDVLGATGPRFAVSGLQRLLDANHDGDMSTVFRTAMQWNDEVGINLRRAAIESGISVSQAAQVND